MQGVAKVQIKMRSNDFCAQWEINEVQNRWEMGFKDCVVAKKWHLIGKTQEWNDYCGNSAIG